MRTILSGFGGFVLYDHTVGEAVSYLCLPWSAFEDPLAVSGWNLRSCSFFNSSRNIFNLGWQVRLLSQPLVTWCYAPSCPSSSFSLLGSLYPLAGPMDRILDKPTPAWHSPLLSLPRGKLLHPLPLKPGEATLNSTKQLFRSSLFLKISGSSSDYSPQLALLSHL